MNAYSIFAPVFKPEEWAITQEQADSLNLLADAASLDEETAKRMYRLELASGDMFSFRGFCIEKSRDNLARQ